MDHIKSKPKHPRGSKEGSSRSQEEQHVEEKVSSTENNDDLEFASPTSAPPKLYSGSLFLLSNDPFGCFTNENQDSKDDKHYNKFFSYNKPSKENSYKHSSYSQGDLDSVGGRNTHFDNLIHETKSDLDISDMLSKQNSSLADARLSPDRLDPATNKAIIDIFEDNFTLNDALNQEQSREDTNKNQTNQGRSKVERENKAYNSPKRQKENRNFAQPQIITPPMGYMQSSYMPLPSQPYTNMMPPQGYAYPLNDGGFRRINQYPQTNSYYQYDGYSNDRAQGSNNFGNTGNSKNSIHNSNQKAKREDSQKKESGNIRKENSQSSQQNQKKEKRQLESKANSDTISSSSEQAAKPSTLDSEEFENLVQNALKLAKDQCGCRMLQKEIETEDPAIIARIFDKIIQDFGQLMTDPFGNYLCQKIAEVCENTQMKQIIQVVSVSLAEICYNPHGTRAVQKLIEVVKDQELIEMLVESLSREVVGLVKDNNGNHVVQKCLTNMSDRNKQFIYDSIVENCIDIATHKHGCCVIQRCLDHASKKQKADLTRVVAENALNLVKDQYGNYVVQYVMELKDTDAKTKKRIADELSKGIVELSKQKFSSNVVEKCLQSGIPSFRNYFMELMRDNEVITEMVCDKFANYVLQRFLAQADENERAKILEAISENAESIKNDPFGNKIYAKLCKTYSSLTDADSNSNPSLSPLISETNSTSNTSNRQVHLRNETNYRINNENNNKHSVRKQHMNRNNDRRLGQNEMNRPRRQSNGNQQNNNMSKGAFGHPMPGPVMYPAMRNQMVPVANFGPTMIQTPYFVPQPQMYNQYYNYSAPQQGMFYPKIY